MPGYGSTGPEYRLSTQTYAQNPELQALHPAPCPKIPRRNRGFFRERMFPLNTAVKRIRHIHDSQSQIISSSFREMTSKAFKVFLLRFEAACGVHGVVQELLEFKDTHRPLGGPMPLGIALP